MKRVLICLLAAGIVVTAAAFAERNLRLGRDTIFHSSDVQRFELPNGKAVRTNTWYARSDLLDAGQEFFTGASGLAIMNPLVEGFATITDEGGGPRYLRITKTHTTVQSMSAELQPAGQDAVTELETEGYTEWWVCRQDAR
jgi:hypothetical protein